MEAGNATTKEHLKEENQSSLGYKDQGRIEGGRSN
jgi:hypothetical protein